MYSCVADVIFVTVFVTNSVQGILDNLNSSLAKRLCKELV